MKRDDKRGMSSIVAILIIIVLSLVAIGVVWGVIFTILIQGSSQTELEQFAINLDINNVYEQEGSLVINIQRNLGEGELVKVKFTLSDGENLETIIENCVIKPLSYQTFTVELIELVSTEIEIVSIAPIFLSAGGEEITGSVTDSYNILLEGSQNPNLPNLENEDNSCIPNCGSLQCGLDLVCGESCGSCIGTDICTNGICVPLNCVPESVAITCGTQICGTKINNCGAEVTCLPGCSAGTICEDTICVPVSSIDEGTVEEIWPGTSGMYFGSADLPIDIDYSRKYIKFPSSLEVRCLLIAVYRFPVEGYIKSHIGFNFETSIETGNTYRIFETSEECQAA